MTVPVGFVDAWVRMRITGDQEPMYTHLGYRVDTPPFTQSNADALINEMHAAIDGAVSSQYTFDGGYVLVGQDGGDIRYDSIVTRNGALGGSAIVQNVSLLVRKNTGLGGRRNRGRMFIPGTPSTLVSNIGVVTASHVTAAQTAMNLLMSSGLFTASNTDAAVLFHETPPFTPSVITSLDVQPIVATQRRRLRP